MALGQRIFLRTLQADLLVRAGRDASAQLGDARDQVVKAYKGVATLDAQNPTDLDRQQFLTASMATMIATLNASTALVHSVQHEPGPGVLRQRLPATADTLARDYH